MSDTKTSPIRVRFCPSPTGTPHVGMVRTCLFNWAYARHVGGTFVFRIEDTDAARDSEESFNQIIESLQWMGLDWDEGVGKGGPYGPYRQSERGDIYQEVIAKLVEGGYAYESYSTPEEIAARHQAAGRPVALGYDGFDRDLSEEQIAAYRAEGRKPVLRMRMPDEDITFNDVVRGEVTFKAGSTPDYVIVRQNGDPLYTLVNPVDDALMKITHVLRGEDLLSSTPRQIVLYRALMELGIAECIPEFGHLPYVMGEGNKKLSKRDPESNLLLHKQAGMLPEGLLNYLALLGWSIAADRDVFTAAEMVEAFDIHDVNPNPARFDQKKAVAINSEHIRMLSDEDFAHRVVPFLHEAGLVSAAEYAGLSDKEQRILDAAAPLTRTRVQLLGQAVDMLAFLFKSDQALERDEKSVAKLKEDAADVLSAAIKALEPVDQWSTDTLHDTLNEVLINQLGLKPRLAFTPLRVAITGRQVSPPLFESMEILGRESSLSRLASLREQLGAK